MSENEVTEKERKIYTSVEQKEISTSKGSKGEVTQDSSSGIFRYRVLSAVLFIIALFSLLIQVKWYSFVAIAVTMVLTDLILRRRKVRVVQFLAVGLIAVILSSSALFLGKSYPEVSFLGQVITGTMRSINQLSYRFTGKRLIDRSLNMVPDVYAFSSWEPPAGYTNEIVELKNSSGFLLKRAESRSPMVMYHLHGGGYIAGFDRNYNKTAINYSKVSDYSAVFSLDYRTGPEFTHPAALDDAMDGYMWLIEKGYSPDDIVLCGDSAGAGLAIALTMKLREEGMKMPSMLILSSPWGDISQSGPSYRENVLKDPIFGTYDKDRIPDELIPTDYAGSKNLKDRFLSPVYGSYKDFPPVLIQTGSEEILLSDSETIATKIHRAGGEVNLIVYPGMYHCFYIGTPDLPESRKAWEEIGLFIRNHRK